ncbi:unnamed protein product [Prunus brigantina]
MVNFDQSTDRLSLMHGGGSLPRIHALRISFVGSLGPSSTGSDGRSGGSSGGCLVLGCDFRVVYVLGFFAVLGLKYVYYGWAFFCLSVFCFFLFVVLGLFVFCYVCNLLS